MVTSHYELGEPLDMGTEEQKVLEDWFDRNKYIPFDDTEDNELEYEVDIVTEDQMSVGVNDNHYSNVWREKKVL